MGPRRGLAVTAEYVLDDRPEGRKRPAPAPACRDSGYPRPPCRWYREGREDGYDDGYDDGYAAGAKSAT